MKWKITRGQQEKGLDFTEIHSKVILYYISQLSQFEDNDVMRTEKCRFAFVIIGEFMLETLKLSELVLKILDLKKFLSSCERGVRYFW